MSETINQHQQPTFANPQNGQTPIDADIVRLNDNALRGAYNAHDNDPGIHFQSSVAASRPVASTLNAGAKWLDSDTQRVYYSTGAAWVEIAYLPITGGVISGPLILSSTLTVAGTLAVTGAVTLSSTLAVASNATVNGILDVVQILRARDRIQLRRASLSLDLTFAKYWDGVGLPLTDAIGDILALGNAGGDGLVLVNANAVRQRFHNSGGISLLDSTDPGAGVVRVAGTLTATGGATISGGAQQLVLANASQAILGFSDTVAIRGVLLYDVASGRLVINRSGSTTGGIRVDASDNVAMSGALAVTGATTASSDITVSGAGALAYRLTRGSVQAIWQNGATQTFFGTFSNHDVRLLVNNVDRAAFWPSGGITLLDAAVDPGAGAVRVAGALTITGSVQSGVNTGLAGIFTDAGRNIGFAEGGASAYANIFRQASSAALVLGNGVQFSATAGGFASSIGASWGRAAIAVDNASIGFFTASATTTAIGTDVTLTQRARLHSSGGWSFLDATDPGAGAVRVAGALAVTGAATLSSTLAFSAAAAQLIGGGTSFAIRNNANSANNILVTDAGDVTIRGAFTASGGTFFVGAGAFPSTITGSTVTLMGGPITLSPSGSNALILGDSDPGGLDRLRVNLASRFHQLLTVQVASTGTLFPSIQVQTATDGDVYRLAMGRSASYQGNVVVGRDGGAGLSSAYLAFETRDSGGTINEVARFTTIGQLQLTPPLGSTVALSLSANALTQTTVGAAGAAAALPANPVGYLVVTIAGTNRKIPFYNN